MKISGSIPGKNRLKGNTNPVLKEGMVPSIIYGGKAEPKMVSVHNITLKKRFEEGQFYSKIFELDIEGTKEAVVVKSIQRHKVKNFPIHVDFQRVDDKTRITVSIPIEFTNQESCPGLKKGGLLNVVRRELELSCLANNIPEKFEIDLEGKEIGDDIRLSSVQLGEGMKPTILGRDFMLSTIQAPKVEEVEATPEAAEAEVAATDEKKEEKKEEKAAE
ncbi:50S ribosomal protein L25/general stress protein Ctc [Alphaproteobacteria bacterium]|nr:50S ribosomal protein L25/general stress protein Ctc [Alphaproteobacteria bacterium]